MNKVAKLFILILLLGIFLRVYELGEESFWNDEGATGLAMQKYSISEIIHNIKENGQVLPNYYSFDTELPMYYVNIKLWSNLFNSTNEIALRSFSALFSILSIVMIFFLARKLFNNKVALIAMFFASINLTFIEYSQEARSYSYLLFFSLVSVYLLIYSIETKKLRYMIPFFLVNLLLIYSHYLMLFFISFEALYVIYRNLNKNKITRILIASFIIMAILYVPLSLRVINAESNTLQFYGKPNLESIGLFGVAQASWLYPSEEMRSKIHSGTSNFSLYEVSLLFSVIFTALIMGSLFLYGCYLINKEKEYLLLFMFFIPLILGLIVSSFHPSVSVFVPKCFIYIIVPFVILASYGCVNLPSNRKIITFVIILSILPIHAYYENQSKQDFREAAKLVNNEDIYINMESSQVAFEYYYGEKDNVFAVKDKEQLEKYLFNNNQSFWVLLTLTKYSDPNNEIKKFLYENYEFEYYNLFDIDLYHYSP